VRRIHSFLIPFKACITLTTGVPIQIQAIGLIQAFQIR